MNLDLIGIFGAGLLTFVTPCVLPLIPIYLSALVGGDFRTAGGRGQVMARAAWFSLGFMMIFVLLGLTASSVGSFLTDHKAGVQAFGALLIALFGLKFLGVIRIPWLDRTVRANDQKFTTRFGWVNALVMGLVFAAGWSPCIGPVLGSVLTYTASATADPWAGAGYLAIYGLGFAVPLMVVAAFAEAGMRLLGKIGPHLRKIEVGLGALLMVVAISMAIDVLPQFQAPTPQGEQVATPTDDAINQPVMLAFTSKDCSICQRMKPTIAGIGEQCDGNGVRVRTIDLSQPDQRAKAAEYRIRGVPTFVFKDSDGQEVARLVGEQTERTLKQAISVLRGKPCPGLAVIDGDGHLHAPADNPLIDPPTPSAACNSGLEALPENAPACDGA